MAGSKFSGLGKGLGAIFEDNSGEENKNITLLRISQIEPRPNQPRKDFDKEALSELAQSIATHGLIQPIAVRENEKGFYSIIAGERRWRASKMAGLTEVPVVILSVDDNKAAELALVENVQREDLNPIEEAEAFETLAKQYGLTQEEISKKIGRSRAAIANAVRLLDLPKDIKTLVIDGDISAGHARALLGLSDKSKMAVIAKLIVDGSLSVREAEKLVRRENAPKVEEPVEDDTGELKIDYTKELEKKMTTRMGRKVTIKDKGKTKTLTLEYQDNEDLEALINKICGPNIFEE